MAEQQYRWLKIQMDVLVKLNMSTSAIYILEAIYPLLFIGYLGL